MKKIIFSILRTSCLIFVLSGFLFYFSPAQAHPGRTDSSGCHTCRTNCSKWGLSVGEYHCHRAKAIPQPKEPIKSRFSETGGYTTPAPEYKQPASKSINEVGPQVKQIEKNNISAMKAGDTKSSWTKKLFQFLFN